MAGARRYRVVAGTPDRHVGSVTEDAWPPTAERLGNRRLSADLPVPPGLLLRPRYRLGVGQEVVEFSASLSVVEACVSKLFAALLVCRGGMDGLRADIGEPAGTDKADAVHVWHSCWHRAYNIPAWNPSRPSGADSTSSMSIA
jgi:hypothetical protein